jgi:hypothetical protein
MFRVAHFFIFYFALTLGKCNGFAKKKKLSISPFFNVKRLTIGLIIKRLWFSTPSVFLKNFCNLTTFLAYEFE